MINPMLNKFNTYALFRNVPKLLQRLTTGSDDHIAFIQAVAKEPVRVMSLHCKLSAWNKFGHTKDEGVDKSFKILEKQTCRRVMMKFVDPNNTEEENNEIISNRNLHYDECLQGCVGTFCHLIYSGQQDYAFCLIILHNIHDVAKNGKWAKNNMQMDYFYANDIRGVAGVSEDDRLKSGPYLFIKSGTTKQQGRIASKSCAALTVSLKPSANVDTSSEMVADMRLIDQDKVRFFEKAMSAYFINYVWSTRDSRNDFATKISDAAYKLVDIITGMVFYDFYFLHDVTWYIIVFLFSANSCMQF